MLHDIDINHVVAGLYTSLTLINIVLCAVRIRNKWWSHFALAFAMLTIIVRIAIRYFSLQGWNLSVFATLSMNDYIIAVQFTITQIILTYAIIEEWRIGTTNRKDK